MCVVIFGPHDGRAEAAAAQEGEGWRACESRDSACGRVGGAEEGRGRLAGRKAKEAG